MIARWQEAENDLIHLPGRFVFQSAAQPPHDRTKEYPLSRRERGQAVRGTQSME